ncbi:carboxylate-amine ligase [Actinokineospora enzanensis]|uniref:carboxylate-amine ligase n=1 Tax=Actinokineospora enzanensis TaxID=155975 RepID=UPI000374CF28|nr:glutamate--cysteine ligase [Actinokineospora enzanensis]
MATHDSTALALGVEEEFLLVDPKGRLVDQGPETAERGIAAVDGDPDLKPELLRAMVESATGICRSAHQVVEELTELRGALAGAAREQGALLVATGTAPHQQPDFTQAGPGARYRRITAHVGEFMFSGMTCGCHVHVGVEDTAAALRAANHLRLWLPALITVCANSPFHDGRDTGYASTRHLLWERWPSAGPPPYLDSVEQYEELVEGLLATGAILDRKMVYFDVRPSEDQPTVETRISDVAPTPREAALLAVLIRSIVAEALDSERDFPRVPTQIVRAAQWRAAKDGWGAVVPDPLSDGYRPAPQIFADLVARHAPALRRSGELELVRSTLSSLAETGDGATRQRAAGLDGVVAMLAAQTEGTRVCGSRSP